MKYDFINELGYLALATRLKRVSDVMIHSGRQMYKSLDLDVEPNWYLIFKLLIKYERLSVTEIAAKLHFSHPSIVTIANKMEKSGYIQSELDSIDSRKRQFTLTEKAIQKLPELEQIWEAGTKGVEDLFTNNPSFLDQLEQLEIQLSQKDFMERTLTELRNNE